MNKKLFAISLTICGVVVLAFMLKGFAVEEAREEVDIPSSAALITEDTVSSRSVSPEVLEYYDVPLDDELQSFIFGRCERYNLNPAIVIAMIDVESKFKSDAVSDRGASFGLMQVQPRWHTERIDRLGVYDLLDPYQNVEVGIDYLAELVAKDRGIAWALMAYNGGYSYANAYVSRGELSDYAHKVMNIALNLEWR